MPALRISLFGKFQTQFDTVDLPGLEARKVQELFCFLLLHCHTTHHREKLASYFWENQSTANSKKYLRQTLWQLQSALSMQSDLLLVDDEWIQVNPQCDFWLDVAVLETAFHAVQSLSGCEISASQATKLEQAVQLYSGDLLAGWYQDWCIFERERLQSIYLGARDKLIGYYEVQQQFAQGIAHGLAILQQDRARECTHRQMMRLFYHAGDRTGALRQYNTCVTALHEELGVEPARSTVILYEQICDDTLAENLAENMPEPLKRPSAILQSATLPATSLPTEEAIAALPRSALADMLQTLHQLQKGVNLLAHQVENCVHTIERTIQSR